MHLTRAQTRPEGLDPANLEATGPLQENLDSWPAASSVRRTLSCVCWRAVLLEDESDG